MYRPGAGAYNDHDPWAIVDKVYNLSYQASLLPDFVKVICPEIENIPHSSMSKTMHGAALEAAMNLANGATDISFAMLGELPEEMGFYEEGLKLFAEQSDYWERLSEVSKGSVGGGVCYAKSRLAHLRQMKPEENMLDFNTENFSDAIPMTRLGIPLTYSDADVKILHPTALSQMNDDEICGLLSQNAITDAQGAEYIQSRGFDLGLEIRNADVIEHLIMREEYTDEPIKRGFAETNFASIFAKGYGKNGFITKIPTDAIVLGRYLGHELLSPMTDYPDAPYGYSSVVINTKLGGRLAVMACGLWKLTCHTTQRDRLLDVIDYLGYTPARLLTPHQAIIMPRVDGDGKTLAVSVTNCTVAYPEGIKIKIRNPKVKSFKFVSQYDGEMLLDYEECEDGCIVTLPKLSAWSICTVFCDE